MKFPFVSRKRYDELALEYSRRALLIENQKQRIIELERENAKLKGIYRQIKSIFEK